jgi:peptidoglycan/LPS O-acetylase OafA/YrhL
MQNVFLMTIPATIVCAWVFFWFCERPFMIKKTKVRLNTEDSVGILIDENVERATA